MTIPELREKFQILRALRRVPLKDRDYDAIQEIQDDIFEEYAVDLKRVVDQLEYQNII